MNARGEYGTRSPRLLIGRELSSDEIGIGSVWAFSKLRTSTSKRARK